MTPEQKLGLQVEAASGAPGGCGAGQQGGRAGRAGTSDAEGKENGAVPEGRRRGRVGPAVPHLRSPPLVRPGPGPDLNGGLRLPSRQAGWVDLGDGLPTSIA